MDAGLPTMANGSPDELQGIMANFHTRVELYGANQADYGALHIAMEKRGFRRKMLNTASRFYQLSVAQYAFESYAGGVAERERINSLAMQTVSAISHLASIITIESNIGEAVTL